MDIFEKFNKLSTSDKFETIFFIIAFIFMIFSILGWVMELFFRRFVSAKKWVNPGFLRGPYLPIYGIGMIFLSIFTTVLILFEENFKSKILFNLVIILGIGLVMTLVEFIGGLIFIRGMKIKLWDYSDRPLNYKGIICLEFSIIWTILGALFYFIMYKPLVSVVIYFVTLDWFTVAVFLMGIFYGIFIIDLINSLQLGKKISKLAKDHNLVIKWEAFKEEAREKLGKIKNKGIFISPFKTPFSLNEHFKNFIAKPKNVISKKHKNKDE